MSRADCLPKMTPSEFPARAALQIPFELECGFFFVDLDDYQRFPWPMCGGVW